tara:strand:- start:472 stop:1434 length:963 start_codon:yes stop_codon:yes gene_type:complete
MARNESPLVEEFTTNEGYVTFNALDLINQDLDTLASVNGTREQDSWPLTYLYAVSEAFRNQIRFAKLKGSGGRDRFWVYNESDVFAMGWVGLGEYSVGGGGEEKFAVWAKSITNNRFDGYRMQSNMKMTTNLDTAVRNAKRHLLPVTHEEVVERTLGDATDKLGNRAREIRTSLRNGMRNAGFEPNIDKSAAPRKLIDKLFLYSGNLPDDELKEAMEALYLLGCASDLYEENPVDLYCVRVYERMGEQTYDVIRINNVMNASAFAATRSVDAVHGSRRYRGDTLPSDIYAKLAVLSILGVDSFENDIGYRALETVYYVYA